VRILAFDTATRATTVALCDEAGEPLELRDDPPADQGPNHATRLLPLAAKLLARRDLTWSDLDRIAVGTGPGTFTGLRIGIATARALARARGIPLSGVPTLQSLALNACSRWVAHAEDVDTVLAVLDARRGEAFVAAWEVREIEQPAAQLLPAQAVASADLENVLAELGRPALAIGDGAVRFREPLERTGALVPEASSELHRVTAASHCRLARNLTGGLPDEIRPEYLRLPDAEIMRRAAGKQ
jgi:tRNA threonylcarbamoyladenosine biosynthesis protein TsaB